ncbi:predicted protein [Chaetomium globosum CBS 148.51]|uniref:Uncharacterized protein n=1 Tax=Chaetomium globosum (strain ATCC 6205 / CBS 148.51 / DSM 1962 / NBRC 6347 / NRRL 1970) TaxID=306901 RepID=Q2GN10_CHAGB|nr:uncharacterized protein CHGG_10644 [Chaetomium globosum CBS 148.51]EAQ84240.1 predicted protein [Chaetomium globosum CBS 148.51]
MIHHSPSSDPLSAPESQTPPAKPPNPHHQQHTPNQPTGRYLPIIPSLQNHQQLTQRPRNLFSPPRRCGKLADRDVEEHIVRD